MEKIKVNSDMCIGCGSCTGICPEVFKMNDNGTATADENMDNLDDNIKENVIDAKEACPVSAISIEKE